MKEDRSRNEWRLMISLINSGHSFEQIERLFLENPGPGKYQEKLKKNPQTAAKYLLGTYRKAKAWVERNPGEGYLLARRAYIYFLDLSWPGRSGGTLRAVMKAHLSLALKCRKINYSASYRELALLAQVTPPTAASATKKLMAQGFLNLERKGYKELANRYSLGKVFTLSTLKDVRECKDNSTHEVFNQKGFGKSAAIIWDFLVEGPKTESQLVSYSGKCLKTVRKWLNIMSRIVDTRTGEKITLVYVENDCWHINNAVDLDYVGEVIGISGTQIRREIKFEEERIRYRKGLEMIKRCRDDEQPAKPEQPDKQALEAPG